MKRETLGVIIIGWILSSWLTHVLVCLSLGKWGFLVAGALVVPIAIIHGTGCWFGLF